MDISGFRALLTPTGQMALNDAAALEPREIDFLRDLTRLNRSYPIEIARAALETAILRQDAVHKFLLASKMYFTREALEQASGGEISQYRAQRYAAFDLLLDLGCSIGGDTLALTRQARTIGVDIDPLRLELAQTNLRTIFPENPAYFVQADLTQPLPLKLPPHTGGFFDPGRRSQGRRVYSVHRYSPPLGVIDRWLEAVPALGVKLSPGLNLEDVKKYDAEIEFISIKGELKEAVLWFGPLKTTAHRATLLPGPHTMTDSSAPSGSASIPGQPTNLPVISEPLHVFYEPDPAILRAGLVRTLGAQISAFQVDPDIAYLTSDFWTETPFAIAYQVEEWLPFNLKHLRSRLRQRGVERVVVKKRGSPISPEALIRDLHLKPAGRGTVEERIVFLTHLKGKPIAVICFPRS